MKVRDLQKQLAGFAPDSEVICYTEDTSLLGSGMQLRVLDIDEIKQLEAERTRLKDGTPYLKLGTSQASETLVTIVLTSDF